MSQNKQIAYESSIWQNDAGDIKRTTVAIHELVHDSEYDTYSCLLLLTGYGDMRVNIVGASGIQAISLALQQAKYRLCELLEDGYTLCYEEKTGIVRSSKKETMRTLDAVYGRATMFDKAHNDELLLESIERLQAGDNTEEEENNHIKYLKTNILDPEIINYIFHHKPDLSAEEILAKAQAFTPTLL